MLVLTRRESEVIMIGDIEVSIESIRGERVRVGIKAPKKVPVHRKEVWEQIKRQEAEAARLAALALVSASRPSAPKKRLSQKKPPQS